MSRSMRKPVMPLRWAVPLIMMAAVLAGCGGGGGTGRGTPTPAAALPAGTQQAGLTPGAPPAAETPVVSGNLTLQVLSPQDGQTVNAKEIQVQGVTSAGAVVSVNDAILIAGADGKFETTVTLQEGPNLIEIIASDDTGNEVSDDLAVTYEP